MCEFLHSGKLLASDPAWLNVRAKGLPWGIYRLHSPSTRHGPWPHFETGARQPSTFQLATCSDTSRAMMSCSLLTPNAALRFCRPIRSTSSFPRHHHMFPKRESMPAIVCTDVRRTFFPIDALEKGIHKWLSASPSYHTAQLVHASFFEGSWPVASVAVIGRLTVISLGIAALAITRVSPRRSSR